MKESSHFSSLQQNLEDIPVLGVDIMLNVLIWWFQLRGTDAVGIELDLKVLDYEPHSVHRELVDNRKSRV